jgi:hypothetical protein
MKAITLYQPWASLVALGAKKYETRSWQTPYRGLIAIHAGKRFTNEESNYLRRPEFKDVLGNEPDLPLGMMLCICRLKNIIHVVDYDWLGGLSRQERVFGNYMHGRYAWELEVVLKLSPPIAVRGQMGLWDWDAPQEILKEINGSSNC